MSTDKLTPAPIVGGGINTGSFEQPVVVTQMLGIGPAEPIREETLRARFLSFEPLFDSASKLSAYELVLRGRLAAGDTDDALAQMDEDMLLTGLYSLVQDGLTGELPLLVRISPGVLFTDFPEQVNHPNIVWIVAVNSETTFARILALRDAGLRFCPVLEQSDPIVEDSLEAWPFVMCSADRSPPRSQPDCDSSSPAWNRPPPWRAGRKTVGSRAACSPERRCPGSRTASSRCVSTCCRWPCGSRSIR